MSVRVLNLPGWNGSGAAHWQTLWERLDARVVRVEQADWDEPSREAWHARVVAALERSAEPTLLVAHSLGVVLAAHVAATPGVVCRCSPSRRPSSSGWRSCVSRRESPSPDPASTWSAGHREPGSRPSRSLHRCGRDTRRSRACRARGHHRGARIRRAPCRRNRQDLEERGDVGEVLLAELRRRREHQRVLTSTSSNVGELLEDVDRVLARQLREGAPLD